MTFEQAATLEMRLISEIEAEKNPEVCSTLLDVLQYMDDLVIVDAFNLEPRSVLELIRKGIGDFQKLQRKCSDFGLI